MKTFAEISMVVLFGMWSPLFLIADEAPARISLDTSTRDQCLQVLRTGLQSDEFWPAIHAAEGLTLAGHGKEVIAFLTPKMGTENDDQKRCGLARELVRAGDRSRSSIMLTILAGDDKHGHVHAAESLFKVSDIGGGKAIRRAFEQNDNLMLKLMSAAALVRKGDASAIEPIRVTLGDDDLKPAAIAAWIIGQIGDKTDIPRLKSQLARIKDEVPRANFEHALAVLGDEEGQRALERNLTSKDNLIRTYAATFASDAKMTRVADRLKNMLNDPFSDARIRAAQSLLVLAGR